MGQRKSERRLVAILIADVVGYSRLMGLDEANTLRQLRRLRREIIDPRISAAAGRMVKTTGDGFLVEFASPVAATFCAVGIQRALVSLDLRVTGTEPMRLRIGINLGDVLTEADGDIFGDGINIAARLEPLAEPGGLCIARSVYDQVRDRFPVPFRCCGERSLKNIASPVEVFSLAADQILQLPSDHPSSTLVVGERRPRRTAVVAGSLICAVLGLGAIGVTALSVFRYPATGPTAEASMRDRGDTQRLSVVILPFRNLSADKDQDFFADGLTEDLTTDLSHLSGMFVVARNSAVYYKDKSQDFRKIGRDLNVHYILEGSVRRVEERVAVDAQLIDADTGGQVWGDRFEGDRSRLGALQIEFVARLARSLDVQIVRAESLKSLRARPTAPDAADLAMRGWADLNKGRTASNTIEARGLFEQALRMDGNSESAMIGLARALTQQVLLRASGDQATDLDQAERLIDRVIAENPEDAMVHFVRGELFRSEKRIDEAIAEYQLSLHYNPNDPLAYAAIGFSEVLNGNSKASFSYLEHAVEISPRDISMGTWWFYICHAHTHLAEWEQTIEWCGKAVSVAPYYAAYVDLAAAYAWTDRLQDAHVAVQSILKMRPGYTVRQWATAGFSDNPRYLVEYDRIVSGLRKAGLPE